MAYHDPISYLVGKTSKWNNTLAKKKNVNICDSYSYSFNKNIIFCELNSLRSAVNTVYTLQIDQYTVYLWLLFDIDATVKKIEYFTLCNENASLM